MTYSLGDCITIFMSSGRTAQHLNRQHSHPGHHHPAISTHAQRTSPHHCPRTACGFTPRATAAGPQPPQQPNAIKVKDGQPSTSRASHARSPANGRACMKPTCDVMSTSTPAPHSPESQASACPSAILCFAVARTLVPVTPRHHSPTTSIVPRPSSHSCELVTAITPRCGRRCT